MANEVSEPGSIDSLPIKKQKTGGRVKKPLDQLMAETRIRNDLAAMHDDTNVPEELAAIYLCTSVSELAEYRKPAKKGKSVGGSSPQKSAKFGANVAEPPRLKMIKPIRQGAVGQNQKVFYKLGHLREFRDLNVVESSFEAAVNAGIYGFMTIQMPYFAAPPKRSDRGRLVLIGNAWDRSDPDWESLFNDLYEGKLSVAWLTRAEAAKCRWTKLSAHKALANTWLRLMKDEASEVKSALLSTEIAEVVPEGRPSRGMQN
jgi:hypothetical protein